MNQKHGRCVIVGGAGIENYEFVKSHLKQDDFFVFCDKGFRHAEMLGAKADLVIGDFDSSTQPEGDFEIIVLPREKDDTDTFYAIKECIRRGFKELLLVGFSGQRMDHTLVNIHSLLFLEKSSIKASLIDDYSVMSIVGEETVNVDSACSYFSLIALGGICQGITIENAKYPLSDGEITPEYQYGCSNEVLPHMQARVSVKKGRLLLVQIYKDS